MNLSVVIPVRPPDEGKTRLAGALDARARAAVVERMFRHVLLVAVKAVTSVRCHVVSRSPLLLDLAAAAGARVVREDAGGQNAALTQASRSIADSGPVLALSADLPLLGTADIAAMFEALDHADVVAATDRAGTGTNALLLRETGLIAYAFGEGSLARHRAAAEAGGLRFAVIRRPGLASDLDEPADLALLGCALSAA